jgi:hypothetical protein
MCLRLVDLWITDPTRALVESYMAPGQCEGMNAWEGAQTSAYIVMRRVM